MAKHDMNMLRKYLELTLQNFDLTDARCTANNELFYWWTQLTATRTIKSSLMYKRMTEVAQFLPPYIRAQTKLTGNETIAPELKECYAADDENTELSVQNTCLLLILITEYQRICWEHRMQKHFQLDSNEYELIACQLSNAIWEMRLNGGFIRQLNNKFCVTDPIEPFWFSGLAYYALFNRYELCRQRSTYATQFSDTIFTIFASLSTQHLLLIGDEKISAHCDQYWLAASIKLRAEIGVAENHPWVKVVPLVQQWEINWDRPNTPLYIARRCHALLMLTNLLHADDGQLYRNWKNVSRLLDVVQPNGLIINKMSVDVEATCYAIHSVTEYIKRYSQSTAAA